MKKPFALFVFLLIIAVIPGCGGGGGNGNGGLPSLPPVNGGNGGSEVAVSVSPSQVTLGTGMLQQFEATVMGASDTSVTWTVDEEQDSGMIFEDGSYIAPSTPNITRTIRATSVANPAKSATAAVYVIESDEQNVQITIDPEIDVIEVGQSLQFTHTITGLSNKAVTWSVVESNGGTVTQTGLYTTPNFSGEYHVRVASQVYPLKYATAKVYVENLPPMPAPPPPPD